MYINSEITCIDENNQKIGKENCFITMRFSTVQCTGLEKTGKTSFCNLLMNKPIPSISSSNSESCTLFIKRSTKNISSKNIKWTEIDLNKLNKLIDELNEYKKRSKESGLLTPDEIWDILLLLDTNAPIPALCLLQHSVVTFVTYKMLGEDFKNSPEKFTNQGYSRFVKEFLSIACIRKIKSTGQKNYTAFVGIHNGSSAEDVYVDEAKEVDKNLKVLMDDINCTITKFDTQIWSIADNQFLHQVNLKNHKNKHFENVNSQLEDAVTKNSTHKVSLTWILLYFKIQKNCFEKNTYFVEYAVVYETLWKVECSNSNENELKNALNFFHSLGALFYYDSVEGLDNFVFTDYHWIFDNLQYLYKSYYSENLCDHHAGQVLKYEGRLKSSMIEEIKSDHSNIIEFKLFVKLLEYLRFVAPVNKVDYFMPSILDSHEDYEGVFEHYGELKFKPLLITFSSGSIHRSVFCYLAAHMVNNLPLHWSKMEYNRTTNRLHTFKDLITFSTVMNKYKSYVCILDKIFFLEIRIYSKIKSDCPINLHCTVRKFIEESLRVVCAYSLKLCYDNCKYGYFCLCTDCDEKQHLMMFKRGEDAACCSQTGDLVVLEGECYTRWFDEVCDDCSDGIRTCMHIYVYVCACKLF